MAIDKLAEAEKAVEAAKESAPQKEVAAKVDEKPASDVKVTEAVKTDPPKAAEKPVEALKPSAPVSPPPPTPAAPKPSKASADEPPKPVSGPEPVSGKIEEVVKVPAKSVDTRNPTEVNVQAPTKEQKTVDSRNEAESTVVKADEEPKKVAKAERIKAKRDRSEVEAEKLPKAVLRHTGPRELPNQPTDFQEPVNSDIRSEAEKASPLAQKQPTDRKPANMLSTEEKDRLTAVSGKELGVALADTQDAQAFERNGALQNDAITSNKGSRKA